jgi:hypothetical protein
MLEEANFSASILALLHIRQLFFFEVAVQQTGLKTPNREFLSVFILTTQCLFSFYRFPRTGHYLKSL